MESKRPHLVTKQGIVIDLILTVLFFAFMMTPSVGSWVNPVGLFKHVPWTEAPLWARWAGAAYCATCLSGVFWMALCLFRVTLVDQLALSGNKESR